MRILLGAPLGDCPLPGPLLWHGGVQCRSLFVQPEQQQSGQLFQCCKSFGGSWHFWPRMVFWHSTLEMRTSRWHVESRELLDIAMDSRSTR